MLWTHPTPRAASWPPSCRPSCCPGTRRSSPASCWSWRPPALVVLLRAYAAGAGHPRDARSARTRSSISLFQETHTIRYALPLVPLVAYLAAVVLTEADSRAGGIVASRSPSPALSLVLVAARRGGLRQDAQSDFRAALGDAPAPGSRRAAQSSACIVACSPNRRRARLYAGDLPGTLLPAPRDYEWLELTRAWREGYDGEAWFVADPRRTDLALVDQAPRANAPVSLAVQRPRLRRRRQARRNRLAHPDRAGMVSRAGLGADARDGWHRRT